MKKNQRIYEWGDILVPTEAGFNQGLFKQDDFVIFLRESKHDTLSCIRKNTATIQQYHKSFLKFSHMNITSL